MKGIHSSIFFERRKLESSYYARQLGRTYCSLQSCKSGIKGCNFINCEAFSILPYFLPINILVVRRLCLACEGVVFPPRLSHSGKTSDLVLLTGPYSIPLVALVARCSCCKRRRWRKSEAGCDILGGRRRK